MSFDSENMWIVNRDSNNVTKMKLDGTIVSTHATGTFPINIVFDGTYVWVANHLSDSLTKIRTTDGTTVGTFGSLGIKPTGLAFDGTHVWGTNAGSDNVAKR
jgi:DNA-binding beta-propeller fold protein YncE